jgi:hypothetical protein
MTAQSDSIVELGDASPQGSDARPTKGAAAWSPRARARLAGVFEVLEGAASAIPQEAILGSLVVSSAAATASNMLSHQSLYWFGFALSVLGVGFHLTWAYLMYQLMRVVNHTIAGLAVFAILVCCAMQALTALFYVSPLLILTHGSSFSAFSTAQLHQLAGVFLILNEQAFQVDLVFFGIWCILTGYLIARSTFLPRILGVLLIIDGVGWATFMVPPFANAIFPAIAIASGLAEVPLMLWLIVFGVNNERWKEQARLAEESPYTH